MANRLQLRRDGAQQWANVNPILAQGELGIELDTSRLKIGDGVTPWNSLKYERPLETESNTANTLVKRDAEVTLKRVPLLLQSLVTLLLRLDLLTLDHSP